MLPWTRKIKFSKVTFVVFSILVVFLFFGFSSQNVLAQTDTSTLGTNIIDQNIALSGTDIRVVIVRIINTVLGLLGIIAVSLIVYAGFIIMTSGGDEGKVASGKKMIINAVIGLAVILSAFAIVKFITNNMFGYGFNKGNESTGQGQKFNYFEGSGFLGTIVRDHYPFVNQKDVARNTAVIVTFNIPIEPASVAVNTNNNCWNSDFSGPTTTCQSDNGDIVNPYYGDCIFDDNNQMLCDTLNTSSVKIDLTSKVRNVDSVANSGVAASAVFSYEAVKDYTGVDEGKFEVYTVVFRPVDYLGSSTENEDYTVKLLGGINKQKIRGVTQNQSIFPPGKSYMWDFQTGTNLDLSPPHVVSVSPANGGQESKDIIIQIDFDEAIDPTTVQGDLNSSLDGFDNILLNTTNTLDGIDRVVTGTWKISNGYKTVEFFPPDICGQNSCGDNKYCLPVVCSGDDNCLQNFYALIHTATSTGNPDAPFQAVPFSGVYDTAMNGLSTNNDDILNKPTVHGKIIDDSERIPDNYNWAFQIENRIDNQAPYIESITPPIEGEEIKGDADVLIIFSKRLSFSTIHGVGIEEYPSGVCVDAGVTSSACSIDDTPLPHLDVATFAKNSGVGSNVKTTLNITHREFGPNYLDLFYFPNVTSNLKDKNQNCFYPGYGPASSIDDSAHNSGKCIVNYDSAGNLTSTNNCVDVTNTNNSQDTGCVYFDTTSTADISSCLEELKSKSTYPNSYNNHGTGS